MNHFLLNVGKHYGFLILCLWGWANTPMQAQNCNDVPFSGSIHGDYCGNLESCSDCANAYYRSITGHCNNLNHPLTGATGAFFSRLAGANYAGDGNTMIDRTNPREISNLICHQEESIPDERGLSAFMFSWLQFIDHDLDLVAESEEHFPIAIPMGDPFFDPFQTGNQFINFERSEFEIEEGVRQHRNELTSWMDGSGIYGSSNEVADWLRTHQNGKLKMSSSEYGNLLPWNTVDGEATSPIAPDAPAMAGDRDETGAARKVLVAGDVRANEQPTLTALHTLFVREHNRFCDKLKNWGYQNDEYMYQIARAYVIGLLQSITYNEALPALGLQPFPNYHYDPTIDPRITHEFATAAYRFGHSMLPSGIAIVDEHCEAAIYDTGRGIAEGEIALRDAFFNPTMLKNNGMEAILRGIATQTQQKIDQKVIDDVRNFLFGAPGSGGLDLVTLNLQRGRDHGLADFNSIRVAYGLPRLTSFAQLTDDVSVQQKMAQVYGDINNVDAWLGMVSEKHLPNASIGATIHAILWQQFNNIKQADRFWFENNPLLLYSEINEIRNTTLADVIARNTDAGYLGDVFFASPCENSNELCENSAQDASYEWIEKVVFFKNNEPQRNQSGNDDGYGDYRNITFDLQGQDYAIFRILPKTIYGDGYLNYKIWIDYNEDGYFNDSDELVYRRNYKKRRCNGYFYFPQDVRPDTYRMRIGMSYGDTNFSACDSYTYGELEDYLIFIDPENTFERGNAQPNFDLVENDNELIISSLTVFPNPTSEFVNIVLESEQDETDLPIYLYDYLGKMVLQTSTNLRQGENLVEVQLPPDLRDGTYLLQVKQKGKRAISKRVGVVRE